MLQACGSQDADVYRGSLHGSATYSRRFELGPPASQPVVPFLTHSLVGVLGSPTKIDRTKVGTLIPSSLLEDLVRVLRPWRIRFLSFAGFRSDFKLLFSILLGWLRLMEDPAHRKNWCLGVSKVKIWLLEGRKFLNLEALGPKLAGGTATGEIDRTGR